MPKIKQQGGKAEFLRKDGALNPHPESVSDELFKNSEFFDSKDLVQVKYEMVRRVHKDSDPITKATKKFGFSRPSFYQAQSALKTGGISALVPKRRGPKGSHKLSDKIMEFVEHHLESNELVKTKDILTLVKDRFGVEVHPRSIDRALERRKKKKKSIP